MRGVTQPVEPSKLGAQNTPAAKLRVAIHAVENFVGTTGVKIVFHHEVQKLPEAFAYLVYEFRE